jgi:NADH-quinone oxidoreductase subunit H
MAFGWKTLIPVALAWTVLVATIRAITLDGGFDQKYLLAAIAAIVVLTLGLLLLGGESEDKEAAVDEDAEFDAFAGGYPVPPMPGQGLARTDRPTLSQER